MGYDSLLIQLPMTFSHTSCSLELFIVANVTLSMMIYGRTGIISQRIDIA